MSAPPICATDREDRGLAESASRSESSLLESRGGSATPIVRGRSYTYSCRGPGTPDPLILCRRRILIVRPLLLSALLVRSGCSTQSPSASDDTSRDAPDRVETPAAYSESRAGEASVVWEEEEIVLERGRTAMTSTIRRRSLHPIVEKQMRALAQIRREQRESQSRRERRRWVRKLRMLQRQIDRAIEAELTAEQVEAYRAFRDEQRERWRDAWQERR